MLTFFRRFYLLLALFLAAFTAHGQQVLKLNLKEGATYQQHQNTNMNISQQIMGQQMDITNKSGGSTSYKVLEKKDGYYLLEGRFNAIKFALASPMMQLSADTEQPDSTNLMYLVFAKMLNKPFSVSLNEDGTVREVKGIDKIYEEAIDGMEGLDAAQKAQLKAQIAQTYGNESFKSSLEAVTAIYPAQAVSVNDSWKKEISLNAGVPVVMTNTYTLTGIKPERLIKVEGHLSSKSDEVINLNGLPAKANLSGTQSSTIKADAKTGWIQQANLEQKINGTVDIQDNPQVPGGMQVPMSIETTSTYTNNQ